LLYCNLSAGRPFVRESGSLFRLPPSEPRDHRPAQPAIRHLTNELPIRGPGRSAIRRQPDEPGKPESTGLFHRFAGNSL
jgi:hypothetical protein